MQNRESVVSIKPLMRHHGMRQFSALCYGRNQVFYFAHIHIHTLSLSFSLYSMIQLIFIQNSKYF